MNISFAELLQLIKIEPLDKYIFNSQGPHFGFAHIYGGQMIAQGLFAARAHINEERALHSFHSYFLHPGCRDKAVVYDVENLRNGQSLTVRRVKAVQDGRAIFDLTASYHQHEAGFEHQKHMPTVTEPENSLSEAEILEKFADKLPLAAKTFLASEKAFDIRIANPENILAKQDRQPIQYLWIKANGTVPEDQFIQQIVLAYASDWGFLTTALLPHDVYLWTPRLKVATIDHAMWFHRPINLNQWLLFAIESPSAANTRGYVRGDIYDREGNLVASATQEGMIRFTRPPKQEAAPVA